MISKSEFCQNKYLRIGKPNLTAILRQALVVVLLSFLPGMPGIVVAEENGLNPGGVVIELLVNAETGFTAITSPTTSLLINCRALETFFGTFVDVIQE